MEGDDRVRVFARLRPSAAHVTSCPACVEVDEAARTVRLRNSGDAVGHAADGALEARGFVFDGAFPPSTTQRDVFTQVGLPVLQECLKGFNGCILAYGQTGSGKTHSLLHQGENLEEAGLLPRLAAGLFVHVAGDTEGVYDIQAAAVHVYKEQVDDLLHPQHESGGGLALLVQNSGIIPGLTWVRCERPQTLLDVFSHARSNLVYAETNMNKASSRSHAVFQVRIMRRPRGPTEGTSGEQAAGAPVRVACTHGKLSVVDLAGSERVKKSGVEGLQLREATAINKSLLAFGNVVSALAARRPHVPMRDSKLTRILDGSIGGNCKTALLVCVSPAPEHAAETLSSLEFALRAMRVEVAAKANTGSVELRAGISFADLAGDLQALGVPLGDELQTLRQAAGEASERAARSEAEIARLRAELLVAEREARCWREAAEAAQAQGREASEQVAGLRAAQDAVEQLAEERRVGAAARETAAKGLQVAYSELQAREAALTAANGKLDAQVLAATARAEQAEMQEEALLQELARCRADAKALEGQLAEAQSQRDTALERARSAEAALEEELDALASEVEASAERESERQREAYECMAAERQAAAEALRAALATAEEWRGRSVELKQRVEALEVDAAKCAAEAARAAPGRQGPPGGNAAAADSHSRESVAPAGGDECAKHGPDGSLVARDTAKACGNCGDVEAPTCSVPSIGSSTPTISEDSPSRGDEVHAGSCEDATVNAVAEGGWSQGVCGGSAQFANPGEHGLQAGLHDEASVHFAGGEDLQVCSAPEVRAMASNQDSEQYHQHSQQKQQDRAGSAEDAPVVPMAVQPVPVEVQEQELFEGRPAGESEDLATPAARKRRRRRRPNKAAAAGA
mmetsp:Transcript_45646/g.141088  ORF Transcript_45646/g.141088 Transcript_45646/m.141088 type:complete len:865 (+) Transcript_45646:122-2716(+)